MKNRSNEMGSEMDPELKRLIEGLTPNQIKLLTSIFAGRARLIRKQHAAASLAKWKDRKDYRWN
jgi:hypothetical protein